MIGIETYFAASTQTRRTPTKSDQRLQRLQQAHKHFPHTQGRWILIARVNIHPFIICHVDGYEKISKKLTR